MVGHSRIYGSSSGRSRRSSVSVLSIASTVIWLTWAVAGLAGLGDVVDEPMRLPRVDKPVTVERLNVDVLKTTARHPPAVAAAHKEQMPIPQAPLAIPMPTLAPVADPKLDVPFPVVVKGPSEVVESCRAAPMPVQAMPAVEHLTLGEGEGDQPKPEYPREAKLAHEEGNVVVQMTIDQSGAVTEAKITSASPWPILNQAALREVRDEWHFPRGSVRYKDIDFVFQLR